MIRTKEKFKKKNVLPLFTTTVGKDGGEDDGGADFRNRRKRRIRRYDYWNEIRRLSSLIPIRKREDMLLISFSSTDVYICLCACCDGECDVERGREREK